MRQTITISVPVAVKKQLDRFEKDQYMNRSDVVREALRYYFGRKELETLRRKTIPFAQKQGLFTDEDVFAQIS